MLKAESPDEYQKLLEKSKEQYYKNRERNIASRAERRAKNREKENETAKLRGRKRRESDPVFRWRELMGTTLRNILEGRGTSDSVSIKYSGLPCKDLRKHLVDSFEETYGYAWDGTEEVHIDHIVPLCTEETIDGKMRLCNYKNLRLIRASDNLNKGTKLNYCINAN